MSEHSVHKFGGSSMGDPDAMMQSVENFMNDPDATIVTASAPGSTDVDPEFTGSENKVTARLISHHRNGGQEEWLGRRLDIYRDDPRTALAADFAIPNFFEGLATADTYADHVRLGEDFTNDMIGFLTEAEIIPADRAIFIEEGHFLMGGIAAAIANGFKSRDRLSVAGFYGVDENGNAVALPRGGTDITHALLTNASGSRRAVNWTDVNGFYSGNPRVLDVEGKEARARHRVQISYDKLRAAGNGGTAVFHPDAIKYLKGRGIETVIKDTFNPDKRHTTVVDNQTVHSGDSVEAVALFEDAFFIKMEMDGMNDDAGVARTFAGAVSELGVSFQHMPSDIDSMSLVFPASQLEDSGYNDIALERVVIEKFPKAKVESGRVDMLSVVTAKKDADFDWMDEQRARAFREAGIRTVNRIGQFSSYSNAIFVQQGRGKKALDVTHRALIEEPLAS